MSAPVLVRPGGPVSRLVVGALVRWLRARAPATRERLGAAVASLAWGLGIRRAVTLDNLRHAFPEKPEAERRAIARGAYRTMALAALDAVTSDLLSDAEVERAVSAVDWKGLDALLAAKKPVLIASAHLGSWELFAEVMARRGAALSGVMRPLAGAFNEWVVANRQRAGLELILQRGALVNMVLALDRGRAVVQAIDQVVLGPEAVFVPFFGRLAATTPAITVVARRSRAPVYVVCCRRTAEGLQVAVEGPVAVPQTGDRRADLVAHVARLTEIVEAMIREAPEQWLWLHRRWKRAPPSDAQAQQEARLEDGRIAQGAE